MKDLGKASQFLGISIYQDESKISIHQIDFIDSLIKRFGFENCKAVSTPVEVGNKLDIFNENDEFCDQEKY